MQLTLALFLRFSEQSEAFCMVLLPSFQHATGIGSGNLPNRLYADKLNDENTCVCRVFYVEFRLFLQTGLFHCLSSLATGNCKIMYSSSHYAFICGIY
jgi:hypothetical protein